MNQPFRPASKLSRAGSALAAILTSALVLGAVIGLADHYGSQVQVATTAAAAQRA